MSNPEAKHGRSILDRDCGRYLDGHRLTKAHGNLPSAMGYVAATNDYKASGDGLRMYNQAGVDALEAVRAVVASFGAPIAFRKLYGILNAMEMHVEETPYSVEALQHLGEALEATARLYQVDQQQHTQLARALATFLRTVEKK